MTGGLHVDHYEWEGADSNRGREAMLRFGPDAGPVVVLALPLFEEANRTRAFGCAILRGLAARGIGGVLPDLPGQGDSLVPLETLSLIDIQQGYRDLVALFTHQSRRVYGAGIRSGSLLDGLAFSLRGRWYLSPQNRPDLLRELRRIKQASTGQQLSNSWYSGTDSPKEATDRPLEIAGNLLSAALLRDLAIEEPGAIDTDRPARIVRLSGETADADRHVPGPALWRRSEPASDADLARVVADDIAEWIAACGG